MLNKSAKKITDMLLSHQVISGEQYDIYVYGFELLISFLFSTMLILIAGIIFNAFIRTLAFLVVFIILRSFTGGFHALTYAVCTVITLSTYASVADMGAGLASVWNAHQPKEPKSISKK